MWTLLSVSLDCLYKTSVRVPYQQTYRDHVTCEEPVHGAGIAVLRVGTRHLANDRESVKNGIFMYNVI